MIKTIPGSYITNFTKVAFRFLNATFIYKCQKIVNQLTIIFVKYIIFSKRWTYDRL